MNTKEENSLALAQKDQVNLVLPSWVMARANRNENIRFARQLVSLRGLINTRLRAGEIQCEQLFRTFPFGLRSRLLGAEILNFGALKQFSSPDN